MPRRRARVGYESTSVLGSVVNSERFCLAYAVTVVGTLTPRERELTIALSHVLSSFKLDDEQTIAEQRETIGQLTEQLAAMMLEIQRLISGDVA